MKHTREMIMNHQTEHPGTSLELLKLENRFDRFKLHTMDRLERLEAHKEAQETRNRMFLASMQGCREFEERIQKLETEAADRSVDADWRHTLMDRMDKFENDIRGLTQTIRLLVSKPETRSDHRLTHEEMLRAWNAVHKCFSELEELRRP